jgi:hypothetical protein
MKKLALGIATAAVLLSAAPAMAQVGFYAGRGGIGIGVGVPGPYYGGGCGYYNAPCNGYYDYYDGNPGPGVVIGGGGWHGHGHGHGHHR